MRFAVAAALTVFFAGCGAKQVDPEVAIGDGWEQYRLGEYRKAAAEFASAEESARSQDEELSALYGLACVDEFSPVADHAAATLLFRRIIDQAPGHDLAAWSELALARMQHLGGSDEKTDLPAVRTAYQAVIDHHPFHDAAEEAFLRQQATFVTTLDVDDSAKAAETIESHLREAKQSPYRSALHALLADAYMVQKKPESALRSRIAAIETIDRDPANPPDLAASYWQVATLAEFDVGDFATARKFYRLLTEEYPRDSRLYPCKVALRRMDECEAAFRAASP